MRAFFERFGACYARHDVAQLADFYIYPCMITNQAGTDLICDADALHQHVESFFASVHALGVTEARPTILDDRAYGNANRVLLVRWELLTAAGQTLQDPFGTFTYLYVLVHGPEGWKIRFANLM